METKSMAMWKLFIRQPNLWNGWDHALTPVGFHDSDKVVLFGHPNPSSEFIKKEAERISYYVANPKPVCFTANTSIDFYGVPTATIMWHEGEREAMLGLVTHEAFHAHQMATGCPFGQIAMAMQYPVNDAMIQALAKVEAQLLFTAVSKAAGDVITAALDARATRQALLTAELATFENEIELGEGLATYIEIKTAGPSSKLWNSKVQVLQKLNNNAWGADRLRFYYSGMAWALLCDRYAENWQTKGWRTLADIVAEAINYTPIHRGKYPGIDFDALLTKHQVEAGERQQEMNNTMEEALPGTGLKVELRTKGNPVGGGWNPNTAVTYPGVGRFHPTGLMYIFDTGTKVKVENNCVEKENYRHIVFERSDISIMLDGRPMSQGYYQGSLTITGKDSNIFIPKASAHLDGHILFAEEIMD